MQALDHSESARALANWQLQQACKTPVSFRALAMSSTSRVAIAAASGISSVERRGVLIKAAQTIGLTGVIQL